MGPYARAAHFERRLSRLVPQAQTPLKGGENVQLATGTGFESHTPSHTPAMTPNAIVSMTPGRTPQRGGMTPGAASLVGGI